MIDLGNGLTYFRAGGLDFGVDLVGWVSWYIDECEKNKDAPHHLLDRVLEKLKGINVDFQGNHTLADAFLNAVLSAYDDLKKKQREGRTLPSSTESIRSD